MSEFDCDECGNIWFEACHRCGQMHCLAWPGSCESGGAAQCLGLS